MASLEVGKVSAMLQSSNFVCFFVPCCATQVAISCGNGKGGFTSVEGSGILHGTAGPPLISEQKKQNLLKCLG